ncbi:response regulator [bacterium SCSIO 12741]|nr:response regulator [bacterium SCSIO 12741]
MKSLEKIRCLIVDDEELARKLIETYIQRMPQLELVGKCKNPMDAMRRLNDDSIDLVFLDIHMPELTGLELLRSLHRPPLVILTTAYKEYALEGYRLDVVDYLLKPIDFSLFLQAINKASSRLELERRKNQIAPPRTEAAEPDYLMVKSEHRIIRLPLNDLVYVQGMNEYVAYHTEEGRVLSLKSLKALERELPADRFIRIHKSYIVAKDRITALEGNQVVIDSNKLPIGGSYKQQVMAQLFQA